MKLQAQYNRITIISTLSVLLIAAAGYYFLLHYVLTTQLDEDLKVEEAEINDYVKNHKNLPAPTVYRDQRISFEPTLHPGKRNFKSLELLNPGEKRNVSSRQLVFPLRVNNQYYMATVTKSSESTEDLVWIILFSTIALIVLLTAIMFFTNRFLLKKLWQPFRNTLSSIKEFKISAPAAITMQPTKITEFRELNESIRMMAKKVTKDYQSLKDFTDHASHEMQTPLAIINSRLDTLIQEPELSEKSMQQVQGIYRATEKLSRLCQSLLLLARIENHQYTTQQLVSIDELLQEKTTEMEEWMTVKNLQITRDLHPLQTMMSRELADILTSNLLRNAIRHTDTNGSIAIQTNGNKLYISNTGKTILDKSRIFDRFYRSDHSDGSGLGLAIVRQICDQYHFTLAYDFEKDQHGFSILFVQA